MARQLPKGLMAMLAPDSDDEDRGPSFPIPEAQVAELAIFLREDAETDTFEKGDRVEYKHARGPLSDEARKKLVLMFWRYLDPGETDKRWRSAISNSVALTLDHADCLVALLNDGSVTFEVGEAAGLRKIGRIA